MFFKKVQQGRRVQYTPKYGCIQALDDEGSQGRPGDRDTRWWATRGRRARAAGTQGA